MVCGKSQFRASIFDLVANLADKAKYVDARLVNAWGIIEFGNSIWVAANDTGLILNYDFNGTILAPTIAVPGGSPTGLVVNTTANFPITNGPVTLPASFLVATENGIIAGYNANVDPVNAITVVDRSGVGAVYKGIAIANGNIYAADFFNGRIDVFDANFNLLSGFIFPNGIYGDNLPTGYAPFNIAYLHERLYVTYALQLAPANTDDVAGEGNGYINIFDVNGLFVERFAAKEHLNSPWALAIAPKHFGEFCGKLLVGNNGNGKINVFGWNGKRIGDVHNKHNKDIVLDGLWGLLVHEERVYFASGPNDEVNGLVGFIKKH
jgi:uncharacterized protein (TIGR03118 family)